MVITEKKSDKSHRGNASQFFVAGELCRREYVAVVTMGNCPNTDILCSNKAGTKFIHIQVKTFRPGDKTCSVGLKAERDYGESFIWVLAGIPTADSDKKFFYYIIPSQVVAMNVKESHSIWESALGRHGQKHNQSKVRTVALPPRKCINGWDISPFLNNWQLIDEKLKEYV